MFNIIIVVQKHRSLRFFQVMQPEKLIFTTCFAPPAKNKKTDTAFPANDVCNNMSLVKHFFLTISGSSETVPKKNVGSENVPKRHWGR